MNTECQGIHQPDVLIRAGLIAGLAELRREPWLLDFVFASLPQDKLTAAEYGEKEVAQAKQWFLSTNIPVVMNYRVDEATVPAISIALLESAEVEQTLADVNYKPVEEIEADWPMLAGPFTVDSYSALDGTVRVPKAVGDSLVIVEGMFLIDDVGNEWVIESVEDRYTFTIGAVAVQGLSNACIRSAKPTHIVQLESCNFRETYQIGAHVAGETSHLLYLHSIIVFVMLREKQELFEKRGFERTVITSQQVAQNPNWPGTELVWSRFVNITGYVRNFWPKKRSLRTGYVAVEPVASAMFPGEVDDGMVAPVSIFTEEEE